jgi:hypothetical protein
LLFASSNLIKTLNTPHARKKRSCSVVTAFKAQSFILFHDTTATSGPEPPLCRGSTITLRHSTLGRTPLDEWSARRSYLYLTTHNTHNRQTSMPPAGFESAIPASGRPQTHALDRPATGISRSAEWLLDTKDYNKLSMAWNMNSITH